MALKGKMKPTIAANKLHDYYSEWYNPIIREMMALDNFIADPEWIQSKLSFPIRLEQVKKSLEVLAALGFIEWDDESQTYRRSKETIVTEAEVDHLAVIRYHQRMIEMAKQSITAVAAEDRDIRSVTVTLPKVAVPLLKQKIQDWIAEVLDVERQMSGNEDVYQVNFQLFPFTKTKVGPKK